MIGKLPRDALEARILGRTGVEDGRVLQGPAYGEDAAALRIGDEILVVNTDPISMAVDRIGSLGVAVACNDVAASGARPAWLTCALFLPDDEAATLDRIASQIDTAAQDHSTAIVGGHTEVAPDRSRPLLVVTCLGLADRYVPTGGADPGDRLLLTGGAGVEATAILATDFRERLDGAVPAETIDRAAAFFDEVGVVPEALAIADLATAMHDPTEGGVVGGLFELAAAANGRLAVDPATVPIAPETAAVCSAMDVDPLRTFGSGALLASVPPSVTADVERRLADVGVEFAWIGEVGSGSGPAVDLGDETVEDPVRDELYRFWE